MIALNSRRAAKGGNANRSRRPVAPVSRIGAATTALGVLIGAGESWTHSEQLFLLNLVEDNRAGVRATPGDAEVLRVYFFAA